MPFTLRAFPDQNKARLGMTELVNHNLVHSYPVLYEKDGEFVAQIKFTAIIQPKTTQRLNEFDVPYVQSGLSLKDSKVLAILSGKKETPSNTTTETKTSEAPKKKKKKPKKKTAAAAPTTTTPEIVAEPQNTVTEESKPAEPSQ